MKLFWIALFCCGSILSSSAQRISTEDKKLLRQAEDSLKVYARKIILDNRAENRFDADSIFTRQLVKALKTPYSFDYPFDSLQNISRLYAPDSSFRIFTWHVVIHENVVRQHGAIQMKTYDGSLKLYPLIDKSDVVLNLTDTTANNKGWIGAIYYKMIQTRSSNQNYYTLLGYDENNIRSNRKIIEVLHFTNDEPTFGGRFFSFEEDTVFKPSQSRYIMEYKKDAGPRLTYDEDLKMIVFEHLESETNEPKKKWTYVPDGDYEGFKWKNGKWIHVEKIFNQVTELGKEPVPMPVKDAQGNTIEDNLKDNLAPPVETMPNEKKIKPIKPKKKSNG
ncbi:MAG TPA: hypothetical protein PKC39_15700 [Ferruginibacter sp.]|nr:hypothetical protein [Ferruginibacter sp.]HMP22404.1 hypothetical protein [Ferruginibacter sp.]